MTHPRRDLITDLRLEDLVASSPDGRPYVERLIDFIRMIKARGLASLSVSEARKATGQLAAEQVRYLLQNDTAERYYTKTFGRLGFNSDAEAIDPSLFLKSLAYPSRDLIGGSAQKLRKVSARLTGGRVFYSSGTTNPAKRKRVYYDAVTAVLIREMHQLSWEASSACPLRTNDCMLLLMPKEATLSMPFASLVADSMASAGVHLYWGARFLRPPVPREDEVFGVLGAQPDFKDNIQPDKAAVVFYNLASKLYRGTSSMVGLLPSLYTMLRATDGLRGVPRFFARPRPSLIAFGGGLKHQGIPPDIRAAGSSAVEAYLAQVAGVTGVEHRSLIEMSARPQDEDKLDAILTIFLAHEVERMTGARCLNVFSAAEILPSFFPVGSLKELYGESWMRTPNGAPPADILFPAPGVVCELREPLSGDLIPQSQPDQPGILRYWNPFNVSHLQVIESEDLFAWAKIPTSAPLKPAYLDGTGLRYVGRTATSGRGGYCA
jgi:hypothetical protein